MSQDVIMVTELKNVKLFRKGKVRDIYDLGDQLLFIATDRLSAFDYVLPNGIPYKGKVLTALSAFWFNYTRPIVDNHLISTDVADLPSNLTQYADTDIRGRFMLVRKAERIDIECVVRGYLAGSAWKEYQGSGQVCGVKLPAGLRESEKLPEIIFTPATKADSGHDENITIAQMENLIGKDLAKQLIECSIAIFTSASQKAESQGLILSDTKFEFGLWNGKLLVIDEMLTPDSSRFWPMDDYAPGRPQKSFDKQYVRDYLEAIGWNKQPPVPQLPEEVIRKTSEKYLEAYRRIVGKDLDS
ncbi:phosphoribosylaminoimidazolesuccinocarboxamide synthase [Candidatus Poribacteria bacterium]|nr:phosphoribosylaminoimidazolesuccinocarboxamide synthase [Candidatus Poribacteria bacterium]